MAKKKELLHQTPAHEGTKASKRGCACWPCRAERAALMAEKRILNGKLLTGAWAGKNLNGTLRKIASLARKIAVVGETETVAATKVFAPDEKELTEVLDRNVDSTKPANMDSIYGMPTGAIQAAGIGWPDGELGTITDDTVKRHNDELKQHGGIVPHSRIMVQ